MRILGIRFVEAAQPSPLNQASPPRSSSMSTQPAASQVIVSSSSSVLESISRSSSDVGSDSPASLSGEGRKLGGGLTGEVVGESRNVSGVVVSVEEGLGSGEELSQTMAETRKIS